MADSIDLKMLWTAQQVTPPAPEDIIQKANRYKRRNLLKVILVNSFMVVTILAVSFIWIYFQPKFITTKLGISLVVSILLAFLWGHNRTYKLLKQTNLQAHTKAYLEQFKALKKEQYFLQTKLLAVYFICLSIGLLLYFWEYTVQMPLFWAIFTYGLSSAWIAFNWFFLRPRTIRKQRAALEAIIDDLSRISDQIS